MNVFEGAGLVNGSPDLAGSVEPFPSFTGGVFVG